MYPEIPILNPVGTQVIKTTRVPIDNTCVYIHTRLDGIVFYVGIGNKNRPYSVFNRNKHWHRTVEKHEYNIEILHEHLSWDAACKLEIELISKYREISGSKLCNLTKGGEGKKGYICSDETREKIRSSNLGRTHSEETRAKMSDSRKGKTPSEETRAKMSAANIGNTRNLGKTRSEETRAKMRESKKNMSVETKEKMSAASRARPPISEETRAKMSAAKKGKKLRLGKTCSEESRKKMSEAQKGKIASKEAREKMSAAQKKRYSHAGISKA